MTSYQFSIDIEVVDERALYEAACLKARDDGLDCEELGTPEEPSVRDCLIMLLDPGTSPPGCEIQDSYVNDLRGVSG